MQPIHLPSPLPHTIVLVGRETVAHENLGLRYVAAAVAAAGHDVRLERLETFDQIDALAQRIVNADPILVGLALSEPQSLVPLLVLARELRELGYRGHLTAGGPFATLTRHDLLATQSALDSIIRHAGELPMLSLINQLARNFSLDQVPGLTTRAGDGMPAPVTADLAHRPLRRAERPLYMGIPAADLIGSRGCNGACKYCGSHAIRRMAIEESALGGPGRSELLARGVGGRRQRHPCDLADEVAELFHERRVRIFTLVDDNLLGDGTGAHSYLRDLRRELEKRHVKKTAWSLMIDAESVDQRLLDEFDSLGVARVLVGVEALTDCGLQALGRKGTATRARRSIQMLVERGIATVFNGILIHPEATEVSLAAELAALSEIRGAYFDIIPLLLYPGTDAQRQLCAEGRASGGTLGYHYRPSDPVAYRFMAAQARFSTLANETSDVGLYAHSLLAHAAIARRLELPTYNASLMPRLITLQNDATARRLRAFITAFELSKLELSLPARQSGVSAILRQLEVDLAPLLRRAQSLRLELEPGTAAHRVQRGLFGMREHSLGSFIATLGTALACGGEVAPAHTGVGLGGAAATVSDSGMSTGGAAATVYNNAAGGAANPALDASGGTSAQAAGGGTSVLAASGGTSALAAGSGTSASIAGGTPSLIGRGGSVSTQNSGSIALSRGGTAATPIGSSSTVSAGGAPKCYSPTETRKLKDVLPLECTENTLCEQANSLIAEPPFCPLKLHYVLDANGKVNDVTAASGTLSALERDRILGTLKDVTFPCLAEGELTSTCMVLLL